MVTLRGGVRRSLRRRVSSAREMSRGRACLARARGGWVWLARTGTIFRFQAAARYRMNA